MILCKEKSYFLSEKRNKECHRFSKYNAWSSRVLKQNKAKIQTAHSVLGRLKSVPFSFSSHFILCAPCPEFTVAAVMAQKLWESLQRWKLLYFSTVTAFRFILLPSLLFLFGFFHPLLLALPFSSPLLPSHFQSCLLVSVPLNPSYMYHLFLPFPAFSVLLHVAHLCFLALQL